MSVSSPRRTSSLADRVLLLFCTARTETGEEDIHRLHPASRQLHVSAESSQLPAQVAEETAEEMAEETAEETTEETAEETVEDTAEDY